MDTVNKEWNIKVDFITFYKFSVTVVLESEAGRVSVKIPDAELYRQRIDVGSEVSYENDVIKKLS